MNAAVLPEERAPADLGKVAARGAAVSFAGQVGSFVLRFAWMIVIARLVTPEHFGLVGMVSAFIGLLSLFRDVGLSAATIQQAHVSQDQLSTLFWINLAVGGFLALVAVAAAPLLAAFYGDQRLIGITLALASMFVFYGAVAQHQALLLRHMKFALMATIDVIALAVSVAVGLAMGLAGLGYWALVGMMVGYPLASLVGMWRASGWTPGLPKRAAGISSMLHFGGTLTLNSFVVYVAYNLDKVLLGRLMGAEALGLYGRAYQLVNMPTESLHTALSQVLFPALSRVQNDPARLRSLFKRAYGLFLSIILPGTAACALFAEDIVAVLLGPKWEQVVPLFRVLTPTILAFALINPLSALMRATGRAVRSLKIALFICPVVIGGYTLGLSHGAYGVAFGFSAALLLVVVPVLHWARHGTSVSMRDIAQAALPPLFTSVAASGATWVMVVEMFSGAAPLLRVSVAFVVIFALHYGLLAVCFGQWQVYADLLRKLFGSAASDTMRKQV
jgi:PST family polysaccharide transporter